MLRMARAKSRRGSSLTLGKSRMHMSTTNDSVLSRVAALISAFERVSSKDLLATPNPQFVEEYNRTREMFVKLNPTFADAAPPTVLDECRYVELVTYSKQIQSLFRQIEL
jgi:hypothetical protein